MPNLGLRTLALTAVLCTALQPLWAQTPQPDPESTSVSAMGWMQGTPPAADKQILVEHGDYLAYPRNRWSFSHMRELLPTTNVWRGSRAPSPLPAAKQPIDATQVRFTPLESTGETLNFSQMLTRTYTDGVLVLHKGHVVYEQYFGALTPERPHLVWSVTKSFVGTLAAMMAADGSLDPAAPVARYLPELANTAFADATVRQLMDMQVGVNYSENYSNPDAEFWAYLRAIRMLPPAADKGGDKAVPQDIYSFAQTLQKEGEHGSFAYKTINTEVLAWVLRRVSGKSMAQLLSERIWQPMGAEQDAYFIVDRQGTEMAGAGLNATVRDLARFGELMRNNGRAHGKQIIPAAVVQGIAQGGDRMAYLRAGASPVAMEGRSYKDQWWITNNEHGAYMARGIHGQSIYINPVAEMVIVRLASQPTAFSRASDPLYFPAYQAMAKTLMQRSGGRQR